MDWRHERRLQQQNQHHLAACTPRLQERQCGGKELFLYISALEKHLLYVYFKTRVPFQVQKKDEGSVLAQYRFLNILRQSELPLHRGWFCYVHADASVFSYLRELDGFGRAFLVVLNFGKESAVTDLSSVWELPDQLTVLMSTNQVNDGKVLQKSRILTEAGEGLLMQYSTHTRFNRNHRDQCYVSEKACYLSAIDILYKC